MHCSGSFVLRLAVAAGAIIGLGASSLGAASRPLCGYFFCHHEDQLGGFVDLPDDVPDQGPVPTTLDLMIAGAGGVTGMAAPVVCYTNEYRFDLTRGLGRAVFKLRDRNGDLLVLIADVILGPTNLTDPFKHPFSTFESTFVIDGAKSTGLFAGAKGGGYIAGWADNDPPVVFATGQSFWTLRGWMELAGHPRCSGRNDR